MKVYSIGRETGCDIVINDNSDVISRRHATLNVSSSGKITIVDLSHNGTYVNGIRISQNVPVPITRKDNVSFAHVARLDWNLVPNTRGKIIRYTLLAILAILIIGGCVWGISVLTSGSTPADGNTPASVADSTSVEDKKAEMEKSEKHIQDSIKQHVQDSLSRVHRKGIARETSKKNDSKTQTNTNSNTSSSTTNDSKPKPKPQPEINNNETSNKNFGR